MINHMFVMDVNHMFVMDLSDFYVLTIKGNDYRVYISNIDKIQRI